jgi:hypothetical protein
MDAHVLTPFNHYNSGSLNIRVKKIVEDANKHLAKPQQDQLFKAIRSADKWYLKGIASTA